MSDLISRKQAIEEIKSVFEWHDVVTVDRIVEHIKALPSAQKTGKWIEHEDWYDTYYECSACGEAFSLIEGTPKDNGYNYCPNCGSEMVGEEE